MEKNNSNVLNNFELNEKIQLQKFNLEIGEQLQSSNVERITFETRKKRKKCGEVYMTDDNIFDFLCQLCEEEVLFNEIEDYLEHVKICKQKLDKMMHRVNYDLLESLIENKTLNSKPKKLKQNNALSPKMENRKVKNLEVKKIQCDLIDTVSKMPQDGKTKEKQTLYSVQNHFSCHICKKEYILKSSLRRHIRITHGNKSDNCEVLKEKTLEVCLSTNLIAGNDLKKSESDNHNTFDDIQKSIEPRVDPLICQYCNRRFKSKLKRTEHEYSHTSEKPYKCETCGKCFQFIYNFKRHIQGHLDIRDYMCDVCSAKFKQKNALIIHKRRHTGEKPYKCNYCEKHFVQSTERDHHERVHTGEKRFQCHICGKCFMAQGNLVIHNRKHLGIKPYKCSYCDKNFCTKAELDVHIVVHTDERPFSCKICNATFPRKCTLREHEKSHSDYCGYVCNICGKSFKRGNILRRHIKIHGQPAKEIQHVKS